MRAICKYHCIAATTNVNKTKEKNEKNVWRTTVGWDYGEQKGIVVLVIKRCKQTRQQQFNTHLLWELLWIDSKTQATRCDE